MDHQQNQRVFPLLSLPNVALDRVMANCCAHCHPLASCRAYLCKKWTPCDSHRCEHMAKLQKKRTATLFALARTCRSLNWLATPYLYHRPYLTADNVSLFLRTIVEPSHGPKLAGHVKALYQRDQVTSYVPAFYEYRDPNDVLVSVTTQIAQEDVWRIPDIPFLAMLGQCSNITELLVDITPESPSPRFAVVPPNSLTKLKGLLVSSEFNYNGLCMDEIQPILAATPNLKLLEGGKTNWSSNHILNQTLDLSNLVTHNSLREVRVTEGVLLVDEIKAMVNALPALEVFEYETSAVIERGLTTIVLSPQKFYNALSETNCTATLRRLSFKVTSHTMFEYQPVSLSHFTALEELEMDPNTLFRYRPVPEEAEAIWVANLLPPNLVKLILTEDFTLEEWEQGEEDDFTIIHHEWRWGVLSSLFERLGVHINAMGMFKKLRTVNISDSTRMLRYNFNHVLWIMEALQGTEVAISVG